jgi:SAM-dependent methyltransferase
MTADRQETRQRWGEAAAGWEAYADELRHATMPVSTWLVEAIAPQPGHTILELAAGPGDTGFLAAELIRPGGTLITSDLAPEMLSAAQRRAERLGLDDVRFRQIDAEQPIDIEAASLDGVLCRWGLMLMHDPESALREIRRILRPGGRLALAAWADPEDNPFIAMPARILVERGLLEPPDPSEPGPFSWAAEGEIAEHLQAAGFVEFDVDHVAFTEPQSSVEDWWATETRISTRLAQVAAALDATTRSDVLEELSQRAEPFKRDDGTLVLPAKTWVAAATA